VAAGEKKMKPAEKKPETVFRIISKNNGEPCGSYSRAYCYEFDFTSVESARNANCHGVFEDKSKYKIAKYRVTYNILDNYLQAKYDCC
jgi:mRNA-degrading endonuclease RelE of RelBE toxin-antitoxin system